MIDFAANVERAYEVNVPNILYSSCYPTSLEYRPVKASGLKNIRIGNVGVFARTKEDQEYLMETN